jgi:hypothetical protein
MMGLRIVELLVIAVPVIVVLALVITMLQRMRRH